nr:NADH:ubiquinone reductase (Na(+)-transporting) subunit C [Nannocystis sp.]
MRHRRRRGRRRPRAAPGPEQGPRPAEAGPPGRRPDEARSTGHPQRSRPCSPRTSAARSSPSRPAPRTRPSRPRPSTSAARKDPATSTTAPENAAKVFRLPNNALVYHVLKDGKTDTLILPIEGYGLWSVLYGYLAVDKDANTIKGITFYAHAETPGLGGEVDNPKWKALWPGRKIYDDKGQPALSVIKGNAGDPKTDPHHVDGLSGATITSNGVSNLMKFWFGKDGFGPYMAKFKASQGRS